MAHALHLYRPQCTSPEDPEAILVGREPLLEGILEKLANWHYGASRQHHLIIGPRGIGKTNFLRILEHRIQRSHDLHNKWRPIAFAEESYGITKISDLLIEALRILSEETNDSDVTKSHHQLKFDDNEERVIDLSLDSLRQFCSSKGLGIIFMVENINRMIERQIKYKPEIHRLRKVLIEEEWLTLIGTSPTYLNAVTKPNEPLFEFFQVQLLSELTPDQQYEMLHKIAALMDNTNFKSYLSQFRSRLRALYHFTGGNPRLTIMLYNLVANQAIIEVKAELDLLLDQLTPFYQDRMKDISEQEGKLLETMALMLEGCSPTELALQARIPAKIVRATLTRLERAGYIRREERRRKRTVYIIPERFFRIWHQMNHSRTARGRMQYLLEFFSNWYATKEERNRIWDELTTKFQSEQQAGEEERAEDLAEYMKYVAAVSEGSERFQREFDLLKNRVDYVGVDSIIPELEKLDREYHTDGDYFLHKGYFLGNDLGLHEEAFKAFQRAIELKKDNIAALFNKARALELHQRNKAQQNYEKIALLLSRQKGLKSIGELREVLLQILREDTERKVVRIVTYLLGRLYDITVADEIVKILQESDFPWRRRYCATMLGFLRAQKAISPLISCLQDEANDVRGSAATALGRIGSEEAIHPLIKSLEDEANNVRGSAATALGRIGSEEAIHPLIKSLEDEANNVRGSAAMALGRIGSEKAIDPLIKCLEDEDNINRGSAATALGRIGSEKAIDPLIKCLEDEANTVRGSAATALGRIGSEKAIDPLIKCLEDEDNIIRGSAAMALGQIGSEKGINPLIQCLKDNASNVRISAVLALGRLALEKPIPDITQLITIFIKDIKAFSEKQTIFFMQNLMRSSFWTGNLKVIRNVIYEVRPLISNADDLYAPYMAAYEYLNSKRDPAVLERQQPEMREAIQLLVDNFDQGYT